MTTPAWRPLPVLCIALAGCISERSPSEPAGAVECRIPLESASRGDAIVVIRSQRFLPDTVRIRRGQAVTWVNCEGPDADPHTSTALDGTWASVLLRAGDHFTASFGEAARHDYTCVPHPHMRGTVLVE